MEYIGNRIKRIREKFLDIKIDGLFVVNPINVSYLSGFTGEDSYLLITYTDVYFITDPRYEEQARAEIPKNFKRIVFFREKQKSLMSFLEAQKLHYLGIEEKFISYYFFQRLKNTLNIDHIVETNGIVESLRMIKSEEEIRFIKDAIEVSITSMKESMRDISQGITEQEVSAKFAYFLRLYGGQKESFDTIIASGPRGALPHGLPTEKHIGEDDVIVIDFGVKKRGYNSDTTRTIKLGVPTSLEKEVYSIVKEAQELAISFVKPGIKAKELDKVARDYIMSKGYGDYFGHGLGHGVGMEIHEEPYISPTSNTELLPGMVITIEPGIYLPGKFGVRIEDMVLITSKGGEVLTHMEKKLYRV